MEIGPLSAIRPVSFVNRGRIASNANIRVENTSQAKDENGASNQQEAARGLEDEQAEEQVGGEEESIIQESISEDDSGISASEQAAQINFFA